MSMLKSSEKDKMVLSTATRDFNKIIIWKHMYVLFFFDNDFPT